MICSASRTPPGLPYIDLSLPQSLRGRLCRFLGEPSPYPSCPAPWPYQGLLLLCSTSYSQTTGCKCFSDTLCTPLYLCLHSVPISGCAPGAFLVIGPTFHCPCWLPLISGHSDSSLRLILYQISPSDLLEAGHSTLAKGSYETPQCLHGPETALRPPAGGHDPYPSPQPNYRAGWRGAFDPGMC